MMNRLFIAIISLLMLSTVLASQTSGGSSGTSIANTGSKIEGTTWELSPTYYRFMPNGKYNFCLFNDQNVQDEGTYSVDGTTVTFTSTRLNKSWTAKIDGDKMARESGEIYTRKATVKQVTPVVQQGKLNVFDYVGKIIDPTSDEKKQRVILENGDFKLSFKPDLVYEMVDKKTGKTSYGKNGFSMMIDGSSPPKVYLLEADPAKLTTKQFVDDDESINKSQIVWTPVSISKDTVIYRYLKPENLKDQTITFKYSIQ